MKKALKKILQLIQFSVLFIILSLSLFIIPAQSNTINGTLEEPDCLSIRYADAHYTDLFTFTLTAPANIYLSATSEQEGMCLYLYDLSNPSGAELIYNTCDDVYPFAPRIPLRDTIPLGAGTYSVELTTNDRKVSLSYILDAPVELTQVACTSYSYPGKLEESDCLGIRYSDAHYTDLYTFTLTTPTVVVLDAASEQEGLCLYVYDWSKPSGSELIASNCNDNYPFIAKINKFLGAGTYSIELTTDDPKVSPDYVFVSSVPLSQVECASYTYPGKLQDADCLSIQYTDAHYTDLYTFTLTSPTNVVLDATSEQDGVCLYMYDWSKPSGAELIGSDCKDTYPFIAKTNKFLGAGTYTIELTTDDPKISLDYVFRSSIELSPVGCSSYTYQGNLEESDWPSVHYDDAHYTDLYTFTLTTPTNIVLDATSEQEGVCLYVYDWSKPSGAELIASSCDDTYPFVAKVNKFLGAGTYSIELTTDDPKISLEYTFRSSVELSQVESTVYTYPGTLQEPDCLSVHYAEAHYTDLYTITLTSPTVLVVDAASEQDGLCLYLYNGSDPSNAELITSNCKDAYPYIAKINKYLGAGTYTIELTTEDRKVATDYSIISSVPLTQAECSSYAYEGGLRKSDWASVHYEDAHYADRFYFTLINPTIIVLDATSEQEGLCLYLYEGNTPAEAALTASKCDDSYPFIATMNRYLGAGTYAIELTTNDPGIVLDYVFCSSVELSKTPTTTTTIPSICPAETVLGQNSKDLTKLRGVRNRLAGKNGLGGYYVGLYYKNASELSAILAADQGMKNRAQSLIRKIMPVAEAFLTKRKTVISKGTIQETVALIDALKNQASPALKEDLSRLKRDMQNKTIFSTFGIKVHQ
jgi:hypothetical protein